MGAVPQRNSHEPELLDPVLELDEELLALQIS